MKKVELLAPAGDLEKLKIAVMYGADAVYFGGEHFSLRAGAGNFTLDEMKEGIAFCHERGGSSLPEERYSLQGTGHLLLCRYHL